MFEPVWRLSLKRRWRRLLTAFLLSEAGQRRAATRSEAIGPSSATTASRAASLGESRTTACGFDRSRRDFPRRITRQRSSAPRLDAALAEVFAIVDSSSLRAAWAEKTVALKTRCRLSCSRLLVTSRLLGCDDRLELRVPPE